MPIGHKVRVYYCITSTNENQYNTIGAFWDEMSRVYGLENLVGLGYKWKDNIISYAIGLKNGEINDYNLTFELPDTNWVIYEGLTDNLKDHFHNCQ